MAEEKFNILSPCGVICVACPSYNKGTCHGCRSEKQQKRKSKANCFIRKCSLNDKKINFCFECVDFPCRSLKKVNQSHSGDKRYTYRHEMLTNLLQIQNLGIEEGLKKLNERWLCPKCGGRILFYKYSCFNCGQRFPENL